jgi:hypothetical protein
MKKTLLRAPILCACLLASCMAADSGGERSGSGGRYSPPPEPSTREWQPPPTREWSPPPSEPVPYLQVTPALLNYGSVEAGTAADLDLLLTNVGDVGIAVPSVSVAGRDMLLLADGCSEYRLRPGRSCTVQVRFAPQSTGSFVGIVLIAADAPGLRRLEVAARGEGVRRRRAAPDIRVSPAEPDFGAVDFGAASTLDMRIENRGDAQLRVRAIAIEGADFALQQDACSGETLQAHRACEVRLRFSPTRPGRASGTLRVRSDDPDDPLLTVPLAGEGRVVRREPEIDVRQQQLVFGAIAVGKEQTQQAQILNRGARQLRIRAITVNGLGFSVADDGCSGRPLSPGRECAVVVNFAPPSQGSFAGRLGVASDDSDERQVTIPLSGKGRVDERQVTIPPPGRGREEERQRCPVQRLNPFPAADHPADPLVVTGVLAAGGCQTYAVRIMRPGRLEACVPPGYSIRGGGFDLARKKGCRFPDDPVAYRRYVRRAIDAGTEIKELVLTRGEESLKEFKLILQYQADRGREGADKEDD